MGWKKIDNYQKHIRNGFRKNIFSRRDFTPEDLKVADILFCSSIGSVGGQEENTIDVTLAFNGYQEIEGFGVKEKVSTVLTRKRMESLSSDYVFNENIVNKNVVIKESKKAHILNYNSNGYNCNICERTFKTKYGWKLHMKRHQGLNKKVVCPHCNYTSEKKSDILRHIARKHKFNAAKQEGGITNLNVQYSLHDEVKQIVLVEEKGNSEETVTPTNFVKVEDMIKIEDIDNFHNIGPDPCLKVKKIVRLTCGEGNDMDERILHVSGSNISLLELPEKMLLAQQKTAWVSSLGRKELEFEVRSVAVCGDTAVLAGNTQVAVISFGIESPEVQNTFISHKSKILQTKLTRIRSKLYWFVGMRESVQMFTLEDDGILAPVTSFLTCDLVLFTMDTANDRLFLLERRRIRPL